MQFLAKSQNKEKKMKQSILQKELNPKEILAVLGVCGAVFAYGYLFVYPKYTEYKLSVDNLSMIKTDIATFEGKISQFPVKQETLDSLKREINVKSKIISYNMEDGMFLIGLTKLMNQVDVSLVEYTMEDVVPYDTFYAIPTTLSVRGDYRHIREVMYYLEEQKNMTQILDFSMDEYIPEETSLQVNSGDTNNITTALVPDSIVYWTNEGSAYHKEVCSVLDSEKHDDSVQVLSGTSLQSEKGAACQVCKPYTLSTVSNNIQGSGQSPSTTEQKKPKSNGIIEAKFKFMMYSAEDPTLELNNDDSSKWKPGKYNPFTTTTR